MGPVPFLLGGRLCLDFVNTVNSRSRPATRDYLSGASDLIDWTWQVGLLDDGTIVRLRKRARETPEDAAIAYETAIELRETLYRIFHSIIHQMAPDRADLDILSGLARQARQAQELVPEGRSFRWIWQEEAAGLLVPVFAVSLSAVELLTREDLSRLKECPALEGCGWLFYDQTKNRSRRWCSMEHCGSTAKARRFAERQKAVPVAAGGIG
ncbi:putative RNA-binding Zn ribbon-like protein [Mesorhizobium sp. J18]|nr:putative RNA-binding Zn ribbon-like protein [Mesorhizobium sp. J18]